jgi:nucleoside-diphosphate-sugar epimerase
LAAGQEVRALRRSNHSATRIPLNCQPDWLTKQMSEVTIDDLQKTDTFVHLAAAGVSPQKADWATLLRTNVTDSLELWLKAVEAGIRRFIICGSCFEYGASADRYEFIPPDAPLEPTTAYGASKAAASMTALALARQKGLKLQIVRPFHVYGEGQDGANFWPSLKRAALAGEDFKMTPGEQVRDFASADEAARHILIACQDANLQPGQPRVKNLGSGNPQTLRQFAEHWWKQWHARGRLLLGALPYRTGEVMRYVPTITN